MNNILNDRSYMRFLKELSKDFPDIPSATAEIINLNAILNLPKGTEHFVSDVHGEYEAFSHILRNGSGVVRKKIEEKLGTSITKKEQNQLATLIYYPEEKLKIIKKDCENIDDWYKITIYRLVTVCRYVASKYTRSKVRKASPKNFGYIIDELLNIPQNEDNKKDYYSQIITSLINTGSAEGIITDLAHLISRLCIDHLHIVGDIFDRGPHAEKIFDTLCAYHKVDVQWGNHDILWMGAVAGNPASIANVVRISTRYSNTETLEDGYGISLRCLSDFAIETYGDDPCRVFAPKEFKGSGNREFLGKMNKAITIIQLKLEGQLIERHSEYNKDDRVFLKRINYDEGTVDIRGKSYKLRDCNFPTVDPKDPLKLTDEEQNVIDRLTILFGKSEKLRRHIDFLYSNGAMYKRINGNLLYHGCVPLDDKGEFMKLHFGGREYSGKSWFDYCDKIARRAYFKSGDRDAVDFMWYLWCGEGSPLFGKKYMTTFERCYLSEKELYTEYKNPYYHYYEKEEISLKILEEFGLDTETSHIITGHVPVRATHGESPIKTRKLLLIDGGFSKPCQCTTGIAGYTLIFNSYGLRLVAHEPFESTQKAIDRELDIHSEQVFIEKTPTRLYISDTDTGGEIKGKIADLQNLIDAYKSGMFLK